MLANISAGATHRSQPFQPGMVEKGWSTKPTENGFFADRKWKILTNPTNQ